MGTEITNPEEEFKMSPEMVEIATSYLETADASQTAKALGIPREKVIYYLNKPECKRFVDTVFLEQGYLNRHKLQETLSEIIEMKLEEMRETEMGSNKDIADLLALAHKMRHDELKTQAASEKVVAPTNQTNVQINGAGFGDNYNSLLEKLVK